jgi:hypothetical protein
MSKRENLNDFSKNRFYFTLVTEMLLKIFKNIQKCHYIFKAFSIILDSQGYKKMP